MFYGWWIVFAGITLCIFGYGAWFYAFGVLFLPILTEFGWFRASTALALSLARLEGGAEGLITGPLIDRFGPQVVLRVGWILAGLGFIMLSQVRSYWMFLVAYTLLLSLGMNAGLYFPLQKSIADWFREKRGTALGFLTAGAGLGGSLIVIATALLVESYGWRTTVLIYGVIALILGWSLSYVIKPHGPEYYGLRPDGEEVETGKVGVATDQREVPIAEAGFSLEEAMKTPAFWILIVTLTICHAMVPALVVHQIAHVKEMGVSPVMAATTLGLLTFMSVPGRFAAGWLADRWKRDLKWLLVISIFIQTLGILILTLAQSLTHIWIYVVVFGIGYGSRITLEPAIRSRYFGRKSFGTIYGVINFISVLGGGVPAPFFAGWVYDTTGSYTFAFFIFTVTLASALVLALFLRQPKQLQGGEAN